MKNETLLLLLAAGVGAYFLMNKSANDKKGALVSWAQANAASEAPIFILAVDRMSAAEIDATYRYIFDYHVKGIAAPAELASQINVISSKYNIFT